MLCYFELFDCEVEKYLNRMQGPEQLWQHRKFQVFFFLIYFFLEDLAVFLSFYIKEQLVCFEFPEVKLEDTPFLHVMNASSMARNNESGVGRDGELVWGQQGCWG